MKPYLCRTLLLAGLLLLGQLGWSQFTYIEGGLQLVGASQNGSQMITALSFTKQVTATHGYGVELGIPLKFLSDMVPGSLYDNAEPNYNVDINWKRRMPPFVGFRYRCFLGNTLYVGTSANLGVLNENFEAERNYYANQNGSTIIHAVYYDYRLWNPFMRLNAEAGVNFDFGKWFYIALQARLGLEFTATSVREFATISVSRFDDYTFVPYRGLKGIGGVLLGLGVKL